MAADAVTGFDADVAVVGLGAIGSSALWRLAARGLDVVGVEQHEPGHPWGGSHGRTRLFRVACLEHPGLTPIARRARDLWRELEAASGEPLLVQTGAVMIGQPGSRIIEGTLAAAAAHALPVERLDGAALAARAPAHARLDDGDVALWDPEAGVLRPEAAIVAAVDAARAAGARVRTGERVLAVEPDAEGVTIRLAGASLRVRRAVVTAGPWLPQLVPGLPITPHRVVMTWFDARDGHDASVDRLPVFIRSVPGTGGQHWIWGHGALPATSRRSAPSSTGPSTPTTPMRSIARCMQGRPMASATSWLRRCPTSSPSPPRRSPASWPTRPTGSSWWPHPGIRPRRRRGRLLGPLVQARRGARRGRGAAHGRRAAVRRHRLPRPGALRPPVISGSTAMRRGCVACAHIRRAWPLRLAQTLVAGSIAEPSSVALAVSAGCPSRRLRSTKGIASAEIAPLSSSEKP